MDERPPMLPTRTWRTLLQDCPWEKGQALTLNRADGTEVYAEIIAAEPWGDTGATLVTFESQDMMESSAGPPTVPAYPDPDEDEPAED